MAEKIEALSNSESVRRGLSLAHKFFGYISGAEKVEIMKEIMNGQSYIIGFTSNDELKGAAIFSVYPDRLHIREVGGSYTWAAKYAKKYAEIIAKQLNKKYVSAVFLDDIMTKKALKMGFEKDPVYDGEYIVRVA